MNIFLRGIQIIFGATAGAFTLTVNAPLEAANLFTDSFDTDTSARYRVLRFNPFGSDSPPLAAYSAIHTSDTP
jgi:hypothetical protein